MDATTAGPNVVPRALHIRAPQLLIAIHRSAFEKSLLQQVEDADAQEVVVELHDTGYIDAAGLGLLVSLQKRLREKHGAALVLDGVNEDLVTLFAITKLDTLLTIRAAGAGGVSTT